LFHWPIESWDGREHGTLHFHGNIVGDTGKALTAWHRMDVSIDTAEDLAPYSIEEAVKICDVKV
jgi:hypothetical protein